MKTAIVTGSSHGVGWAITQFLLDEGWTVYGLSRSYDDKTMRHENYFHLTCDISNKHNVNLAISAIDGKIDLLVNNAAIFIRASFISYCMSEIDDIIDTNVKGTMYVTRAALPIMNSGGNIIFMNSVAGIEEIENQSLYCASKAALTAFAGVLGKELHGDIKVSSIHPGGINTELWNKNNPYPGNVKDLLQPWDIVDVVKMILIADEKVYHKTIKLFPSVEWH